MAGPGRADYPARVRSDTTRTTKRAAYFDETLCPERCFTKLTFGKPWTWHICVDDFVAKHTYSAKVLTYCRDPACTHMQADCAARAKCFVEFPRLLRNVEELEAGESIAEESAAPAAAPQGGTASSSADGGERPRDRE